MRVRVTFANHSVCLENGETQGWAEKKASRATKGALM